MKDNLDKPVKHIEIDAARQVSVMSDSLKAALKVTDLITSKIPKRGLPILRKVKLSAVEDPSSGRSVQLQATNLGTAVTVSMRGSIPELWSYVVDPDAINVDTLSACERVDLGPDSGTQELCFTAVDNAIKGSAKIGSVQEFPDLSNILCDTFVARIDNVKLLKRAIKYALASTGDDRLSFIYTAVSTDKLSFTASNGTEVHQVSMDCVDGNETRFALSEDTANKLMRAIPDSVEYVNVYRGDNHVSFQWTATLDKKSPYMIHVNLVGALGPKSELAGLETLPVSYVWNLSIETNQWLRRVKTAKVINPEYFSLILHKNYDNYEGTRFTVGEVQAERVNVADFSDAGLLFEGLSPDRHFLLSTKAVYDTLSAMKTDSVTLSFNLASSAVAIGYNEDGLAMSTVLMPHTVEENWSEMRHGYVGWNGLPASSAESEAANIERDLKAARDEYSAWLREHFGLENKVRFEFRQDVAYKLAWNNRYNRDTVDCVFYQTLADECRQTEQSLAAFVAGNAGIFKQVAITWLPALDCPEDTLSSDILAELSKGIDALLARGEDVRDIIRKASLRSGNVYAAFVRLATQKSMLFVESVQ